MKKGQEYRGIVSRVDFPDKGIVECEEGIAIVRDCIEGQKLTFRVKKKRSGKAEGEVVSVEERSVLESETPPCPHFGICGSCKYQRLIYEAQLELKEQQVKRLLNQVVKNQTKLTNGLETDAKSEASEDQKNSYTWQGIIGSPKAYEYRNKMEFSFGNAVKDGPLTLGLHKKGSFYDVIEVPECRLVDEDIRRIIIEVLQLCRKYKLSFYHKISHVGYLRHLLVRKAAFTGEIMVDLVTSSQAPEQENEFLQEFAGLLSNLALISQTNDSQHEPMNDDAQQTQSDDRRRVPGRVVSILHTLNDSLSDVIQNDRTEVLYGTDYIEEELLGLRFKISAFSFFQTNSYGAELLYQKAREYVGETKDKIIFDLYSGTGTIAQLLAPVAKKVIGVEIVEEAVEAAKINAEKNHLSNCIFHAGDVLTAIDEILDKPDVIVLDPPRDGVQPKALKKIIDFGVERLLYISCKPTSLVRDLVILQEQGYQVEKAAAVDMFPETPGVETVCLLSKLHEA